VFSVSLQSVVAPSSFLPAPVVTQSKDQQTIVISMSWGKPALAQQVGELILLEIERPPSDEETVIRGSSLKSIQLKSILQKVHVEILSENSKEFSEGLEIIVIHAVQNQIYIVQSANATIWACEEKKWPVLLASSSLEKQNSPLPENFLGSDSDTNIQLRQLQIDDIDEIIVSSAAILPKKSAAKLNLKKWADLFADESDDHPFWIAKIAKT
jgi:hypothetical protein